MQLTAYSAPNGASADPIPLEPDLKARLAPRPTGVAAAPTDPVLEALRRLGEEVQALRAERQPNWLERIAVKEDGAYTLFSATEVVHIEAAGNYVRFHLEGAEHLLRASLTGLEERLDPSRFVRVHRSTILNLDRVARIEPWFSGDLMAVTTTGAKVKISRTYRDRLDSALGAP